MSKANVLFTACLILFACCESAMAQGNLRGRGLGGRRDAAPQPSSDSSTNKRQDVEGSIWEYKVIDPKEKDKSKETTMTGRIRIKQSSVFAVGKAKITGKEGEGEKPQERGVAQRAAGEKRGQSDVRGQLNGLLSQRINRANQEETGGDRIGDFSKNGSSKYNFQFDEDDEYPLSGKVIVQPDTQSRNGVWSGNYEEFSAGRKTKRWRFEMRKIDE